MKELSQGEYIKQLQQIETLQLMGEDFTNDFDPDDSHINQIANLLGAIKLFRQALSNSRQLTQTIIRNGLENGPAIPPM